MQKISLIAILRIQIHNDEKQTFNTHFGCIDSIMHN